MLQTQLQTMLTLQDEINTLVNEHWRAQSFPWYRAISSRKWSRSNWSWWISGTLA
jgi:hypothetical protein